MSGPAARALPPGPPNQLSSAPWCHKAVAHRLAPVRDMDTVRLDLSRRAPGSLRRAPWHRRRPAPRTRALAQGIRGSGRAGARAAQVDGRLHVHERQRHKLGNTAGARLQRAQLHQVPRPRASALHVPKLARAPALSSEQVRPHARTPAALRARSLAQGCMHERMRGQRAGRPLRICKSAAQAALSKGAARAGRPGARTMMVLVVRSPASCAASTTCRGTERQRLALARTRAGTGGPGRAGRAPAATARTSACRGR